LSSTMAKNSLVHRSTQVPQIADDINGAVVLVAFTFLLGFSLALVTLPLS